MIIVCIVFLRALFDSLLQGKGLRSKELELALLLCFQRVGNLVLTAETDVKNIKVNVQEREKGSIKKERDIKIKGASFVNCTDDNIGIADADDLQDPTYSPTTSSQAFDDVAYPCEKCGKHFKNQRSMEAHSKKHLKLEENKDEIFECSLCSKIVSNKYILATHVKSHINGPGKIERALCNVCSKSFANKYVLKAHIQTHSKDPMVTDILSCNVCLKSFSNKYVLKFHKKSHDTDVKEKTTALCNLCSKMMTKKTLKKHMKNIHGEKKIAKCSNCGMSSRMSCIGNHERMCKLSDEERLARKLKCDDCGKALSSRDKLRRHMQHIHNGEHRSQKQ